MRRTLLLVVVSLGCGGGGALESEREPTTCERLRDHLVELRLSDASGVDRAAHRAALRQAIGDDVASCESAMTERQIVCALDAPDLATAAECTNR